MTTPISVGEWNVMVARRHEHLGYCPVVGGRCKGEECELWMTDTLECAIAKIAKRIGAEAG